MGERPIKLTPVQREALTVLARVGEALRYQPWFEAGGKVVCEVGVMERLRKKGAVKIETVGESVFASITERGRAALPREAP